MVVVNDGNITAAELLPAFANTEFGVVMNLEARNGTPTI